MSDQNDVRSTVGRDRPLSPHLLNYSLPLLPITSILGRITGIGLAIGTLMLTWWLLALASGGGAYALFANVMGSPPGLVVLFGFTISLFYHMCKGIRQFIWDSGQGLDVAMAERMTIVVIMAAVVLSIGLWAFILFF